MPVVKTREELVKNYDEISSLCRGSRELYGLLREGMDDVRAGRTEPLSEAMKDIRESRKR